MQADLIFSVIVFLTEPLVASFIEVIHSSYPKAWMVGVITANFKKVNPMKCCNYRELTC
jgi:hypothetical protein